MSNDEEEVGLPLARGGTYYPAPDELDPNVEITLSSLRDAPPDGKPLYSYATLIRYAIKGSPEGRLLLEEIYYAIEQRYPYFKTAPAGWKNSVRHNLSLNACFEKIPRPLTDRGKGSYWTVNDAVDPKQGIHRVRSRRRKTSKPPNDQPGGTMPYPPFPPYHNADGTYDPYASMYPYGYDSAMMPPPPFLPGMEMHGNLPFDPALGSSPDHPPNQVDWRTAFSSEVERLKNMTKEQDKQSAPPEWYKMMIMRLRMGMFGLPPWTHQIPTEPAPPAPSSQGMAVDDEGEQEEEEV